MLPLGVFQIRELLLDDGSSPFGKWFSKLDHVSAVKVQVALARIEQGNVGSIKWFEGIGEIKIHWGLGCVSMWASKACRTFCYWAAVIRVHKTRTFNWLSLDGNSLSKTNQTRRYKNGFDQRLQRNCDGPNSK